jgi:L-malate glycosyltransferase
MRLRVLQLFTSLHPGGMERQTVQLVRALRAGGTFDVRVAALGTAGPLLHDLAAEGLNDVPLIRLQRMYDARALAGTLRLARLLRHERISILHTHDFYTNMIGMMAGALACVPIRIASRRELDVFTPRQRQVERTFNRLASIVTANCAFLGDVLIREGTAAKGVAVLPNAVDARRLEEEAASTDARAMLGIPRHAAVVTMLANLHNVRKDHATFLRAASLVAADMPGSVFVLAGAGDPAPWHAFAAALDPPPRLLTPGLVLRPAPLLATSDAVVLTSLSEGSPNAVLEAMALGRAVVATDSGGTSELVQDGVTGWLCPGGDAARVAAGVVEALRSPEVARTRGDRARIFMATWHSPERQSRLLHELYNELLQRGGRA